MFKIRDKIDGKEEGTIALLASLSCASCKSESTPKIPADSDVYVYDPYKNMFTAGAPDVGKMMEILIKYLSEIQDEKIAKARGVNIVRRMSDVLRLIFFIGEDCLGFSDKQKREIGTLLVKAIEPIKLYVNEFAILWNFFNPFILQIRSALQFLIEHYSEFPVGNTSLSCTLLKANIMKTIEILDQKISLFQHCADPAKSDWDFEKFGGGFVPDTHNWWPKGNIFEEVAFVSSDQEYPSCMWEEL